MEKKKVLFNILILVFLTTLISASVEYKSTSDKTCNDNVCTLTLYSGTRNVFEDGQWKRIEEAKSLKQKGFEVIYLNDDGTHILEVIDFNLTYVGFNLGFDSENLGEYEYEIEDGKMKTKFKIVYNETHEEEVEVEIEEDSNEWSYYGNPFGKEFHLGPDSTVIQLIDANTENLEDGMYDEDGSPDGSETSLFCDALDGTGEIPFYKFNITQIPLNANITNTTLCIYDGIGSDNNIDIWHVTNQSWTEETIDAQYSSTMLSTKIRNFSGDATMGIFYCIGDLHTALKTDYDLSRTNFSLALNNTDLGDVADYYSFYTKEGITSSDHPYLNITYIPASEANITISDFNTDGAITYGTSYTFNYNITINTDFKELLWKFGEPGSVTEYNIDYDSVIFKLNLDNRSELGEDDSTVVDAFGNTGIVSGATWNSNGKYGGAYTFGNTGDDVINMSDQIFVANANISTCIWTSRTGSGEGSYGRIIEDDNYRITYHSATSGVAVNINGAEITTTTWDDFHDEGWIHICVTNNKTGWVRIYLDGVLTKQGQANPVANGGNDFYIGNRQNLGREYDGIIDEIIIFNKTLPQSEIDALYRSNLVKYNSSDWGFEAEETLSRNSTGVIYNYQLCVSNPDDIETCSNLNNLTAYLGVIVNSNFTSLIGSVNDYFYGTNDQYNQLADNFDGYLDDNCDGPQETPHNFTRHRELFEDAGMNHVRIWQYDLSRISTSEGVYNQTRIRNMMDTAEYVNTLNGEITFVAYGTPTWLANTTTGWCNQENPWDYYEGDWASCSPTNHTKLALVHNYIIGNLTQVISEDKINFIPYNEPWYQRFFLDTTPGGPSGISDNITQAIEFGKIYNASYNVIKANYPNVEVGWSMYTSLQTDVLSDYMMANFSDETDFIGLHYYDGTSYFKNLGWNFVNVLGDLLGNCANYSVSCEKIIFDEWDITIKHSLPSDNYTMEVAYFYSYLLNNIPSNASNLKFKWGEIRSYDTCSAKFSEYPSKYPMFIEADDYLGEDYNVTRAFGNLCPSGSEVYATTSADSDFQTVSCKNGTIYSVIGFNIGQTNQSLVLNLSGNYPYDNITNYETEEVYTLTGDSVNVGSLDVNKIIYLTSEIQEAGGAPDPPDPPVEDEDEDSDNPFTIFLLAGGAGLISILILIGIVYMFLQGSLPFSTFIKVLMIAIIAFFVAGTILLTSVA